MRRNSLKIRRLTEIKDIRSGPDPMRRKRHPTGWSRRKPLKADGYAAEDMLGRTDDLKFV